MYWKNGCGSWWKHITLLQNRPKTLIRGAKLNGNSVFLR